MCWGPDCERVHDIIDEGLVDRNPDTTDEDVIMTTWHDDETLWFAVNNAFPAEAYTETCKTLGAVAVGSEDWGREIAKKLSGYVI